MFVGDFLMLLMAPPDQDIAMIENFIRQSLVGII